METLDIAGSAIGLVYLVLEYRASVWLWLAGVVMPAVYVVVFYRAGLYADMALNAYLVGASVYGAVCWLRSGGTGGGTVAIGRMPARLYAGTAAASVLLTAAIAAALHAFTDSTVPLADGAITALSIVAMWMLARRWAEQWLVWLAVDAASTVLFFVKDLPFTAALYLLYSLIALAGYRKWRRMANQL